MREALLDAAALMAAITGILAATAFIARLKPIRWLFRRLLSEPLGQWFRQQVRDATAEPHARIHRRIDSHMAVEEAERRAGSNALLATLRSLDPNVADVYATALESERVLVAAIRDASVSEGGDGK